MAEPDRSVVQAHHEEMVAIFAVLKAARRVINAGSKAATSEAITILGNELADLDYLREMQADRLGRAKP